MADLINSLMIELEYVESIRKMEQLHHEMSAIDHEKYCVVCSEQCYGPLAVMLDVYFNIIGRHYYGALKMTNGNEWVNIAANLPPLSEWCGMWCSLCHGSMDEDENIIGVPECEHIFHEYCFYRYIDQVSFDSEKRIICPHPKCNHFLFIPNFQMISFPNLN